MTIEIKKPATEETKKVDERQGQKPEQKQPLLEQSIIAEGERLLKEEPDKWPGFLNNFTRYVLPENNEKWRTKREQIKKLGYWDKKNKDRVDNPSGHSELWLNQTPEEFFEMIDRVIGKLDVNGEITSAIDRLCNVKNYKERTEAQDELEKKLIPVFARLIAMGYSAKEIRG